MSALDVDDLETSFHSRPALLTGSVLSVLLVAASLLMWVGLGPTIRSQFNIGQVITLVFFLLVIVGVMMAVGLSSITCDEDGLHVRNALRTHHYPWDRVVGAELGEGDPWAYVLLTPDEDHMDGQTQMALAIQRSDHSSEDQMAELRETIAYFKGR